MKQNSSVVRPASCAIRNTRSGFTLIELLISITLVSLVGITVYSVFASGINAWRRGNKNRTYARNIRLTTEKMAGELRNVFEFSGIAFEGSEDSIKFASLISSEAIFDNGKFESFYEVGRVAYFYDEGENALSRKEETYSAAHQQEGEPGKGKVLIDNVQKLEFSYCYLDNATGDYKWKDDWKKEEQDSIPRAVELGISFKKDSGNQSKFSRTIFIPLGTGEQKIELIEQSVVREAE